MVVMNSGQISELVPRTNSKLKWSREAITLGLPMPELLARRLLHLHQLGLLGAEAVPHGIKATAESAVDLISTQKPRIYVLISTCRD